MPLTYEGSFGGERRHIPHPVLSLPGPAIVIDVRQSVDLHQSIDWRQSIDLRLIGYLATEIGDLAREMRLNQVYQWRHLENATSFLKLDIGGTETLPTVSSSFKIRPISGEPMLATDRDDLASQLGKFFINPVRNSRINAMNDRDEEVNETDFDTASTEQSMVRIFFLADLNDEDSFRRATTYAWWLKEWYAKDAGPTRTGRNELIETVVLAMNAVPHRHRHLLIDEQSLAALDTVILLQTYRDDDGYIDEEAQIYQAELLLYTLLLYWPECMDRTISDELSDTLDGKAVLQRPTYIMGISALEYSARWGQIWLDYGLAAKIIEVLRNSQGVQREGEILQSKVDLWWRDWWGRLLATLPLFASVFPALQALDQVQGLIAPTSFRQHSNEAILQSLVDFRQAIRQLYTGSGGITLQLALDSASLLPSYIRQNYEQASWQEDENSPASAAYHKLCELQAQAQLFLLPVFQTPQGALPRAQSQIRMLGNRVNELKKLLQDLPDVKEEEAEIERQAEAFQKRLAHMIQVNRGAFRSRSVIQRERTAIHEELGVTIQKHLLGVRKAIAASIALTLLTQADLCEQYGQGNPYQQRLKNLDSELKDAQEKALQLQKIATERLKFSLIEGGTTPARMRTLRHLNSRKDLLHWKVITEAFLQSQENLDSDPLVTLLAEMLLRRLATQPPQSNGRNHRNVQFINRSLQDEKNHEHFQAVSTALVSALLTARTGNVEIRDVLPLLNRYTQMKRFYLSSPSVLDSDVLDVGENIKEAMLKQAIYGGKSPNFLQDRPLPAEFVLSAWVASQHATNPALEEALDTTSLITYIGKRKDNASQILQDLSKQNRLVGYPDEKVGDNHFYLLVPTSQESEAFLKALDFSQSVHIQPVFFPDPEKLIYLHVHRIRQI